MSKHEEIAKKIATEIFYLPATNGKSEESIQKGTELILKAMQEACREQPFREALIKMDKVIKCLAIELPEDVLKSVVTEWEEFKRTALASEGDGIYLTKAELEKKISDAWDAATEYHYDWEKVNKTEYLKQL